MKDRFKGLGFFLMLSIWIIFCYWCSIKFPSTPRIRHQDAFRMIQEIHEHLEIGD
jgi:hypothetical protein